MFIIWKLSKCNKTQHYSLTLELSLQLVSPKPFLTTVNTVRTLGDPIFFLNLLNTGHKSIVNVNLVITRMLHHQRAGILWRMNI